jgi:hypothetical protein
MFRPIRQFVAVVLAIWLPLFSGSALAASVAMQAASGDCRPVVAEVTVQADEHHMHQVSTSHHHDQLVESQDQAADQHDQNSPSCKDCGVCHFACSGYLATIAIQVIETRVLAQAYLTSSTQYQSFTSAPLVPPPLSRV